MACVAIRQSFADRGVTSAHRHRRLQDVLQDRRRKPDWRSPLKRSREQLDFVHIVTASGWLPSYRTFLQRPPFLATQERRSSPDRECSALAQRGRRRASSLAANVRGSPSGPSEARMPCRGEEDPMLDAPTIRRHSRSHVAMLVLLVSAFHAQGADIYGPAPYELQFLRCVLAPGPIRV